MKKRDSQFSKIVKKEKSFLSSNSDLKLLFKKETNDFIYNFTTRL